MPSGREGRSPSQRRREANRHLWHRPGCGKEGPFGRAATKMLSPPADNSLSSGQVAKSSFPKRREAGPLSQSQAGAAGGDHRLWGVLQGAHSQRHTRPGHLGPPWTPRTTRVQKRLSPGSQTGLAVKGPREQVLQEQNAHRQGRGGTLTAEASTVEETPLVSSRAWLQLLLPKRAALYSLRLTLQSSKQRNHDPGAIAGREGGKGTCTSLSCVHKAIF